MAWMDRNIAAASVFGIHYAATGNLADGKAFKKILLAVADRASEMSDIHLGDYSIPELTITWDAIEEMSAFSESDRNRITDFLYRYSYHHKDAYFVYNCRNLPLDSIEFVNRHQHAGTQGLGFVAEYMMRNGVLTTDQQSLMTIWQANATRYLERLVQTPFYANGSALLQNEANVVLCSALRTGRYDFVNNGSLEILANFFVTNFLNNQTYTEYIANGHNAAALNGASGGEIINIAGWLLPGKGYQAYRRSLSSRHPYANFFFYFSTWLSGISIPWFNWEMPVQDDGLAKIQEYATGLTVTPLGQVFHAYLDTHRTWNGGYEPRDIGRYYYDTIPYDQTWVRMTFREGFGANDQFLALEGMQGREWSFPYIHQIIRYNDFGKPLLKWLSEASPMTDDRMKLDTLFVNNAAAATAQESVHSQLLNATDLGPQALVRCRSARHEGLAWTRQVFWQKGGWFIFADQVIPTAVASGANTFSLNWMAFNNLAFNGQTATASPGGGVTLRLQGFPGQFQSIPGGIGLQESPNLTTGQPHLTWLLVSATGPGRSAVLSLTQLGQTAVKLTAAGETGARAIAFTGLITLGDLAIEADLGLVSPNRLTLAGCRAIRLGSSTLYSSAGGGTLGWDLVANRFEAGKSGFGLQTGETPSALLANGPTVRHWVDQTLGVPEPNSQAGRNWNLY